MYICTYAHNYTKHCDEQHSTICWHSYIHACIRTSSSVSSVAFDSGPSPESSRVNLASSAQWPRSSASAILKWHNCGADKGHKCSCWDGINGANKGTPCCQSWQEACAAWSQSPSSSLSELAAPHLCLWQTGKAPPRWVQMSMRHITGCVALHLLTYIKQNQSTTRLQLGL